MALTADILYERMAGGPLTAVGGYHRFPFEAMGTTNEIAFSSHAAPRARAFRDAVLRWVADFEACYSRFIDDSLVSRINRAAGKDAVAIDARTAEIFALCDAFHWRTGGVFDPTTGPLISLWDHRIAHDRPPSDEEVAAALARVGWTRTLRTAETFRLPDPGMSLDLGGIGKEYAVDQLARLADAHGVQDFAISLGRDIRVRGRSPNGEPWRLGLEHPAHMDRCWGGVAIHDAALCCSGDYRRYFEVGGQRYGHIIDPRTGRPADHGCRAAWVVAPTCTEAGVLSTSCLVLGPDEGTALIETSRHAAGCFWTERGILQTRRFSQYEIPEDATTP